MVLQNSWQKGILSNVQENCPLPFKSLIKPASLCTLLWSTFSMSSSQCAYQVLQEAFIRVVVREGLLLPQHFLPCLLNLGHC